MIHVLEGYTPPHFGTQYSGGVWTVRSTQMVGTQYANILLYRTQTSIFTFKSSNFQQETQQTWHTTSNNSYFFAHSLRSRYLEVIEAFMNLHSDFGSSKNRKSYNQAQHS